MKTRGILDNFSFVDIDYCQFSDWGYCKPTRFWGSPNVTKKPHVICDHETCPNLIDGPKGRKRHKFRLGGYKMKFSTRQKGRISEKVVEYLLWEAPNANAPHTQGKNMEEKCGNLLGGELDGGMPTLEVEVAQRLLQPNGFYHVGSCHSKNSNFQLILKLPMKLSNGETHVLKVLIDTGAEANLVRLNLLPQHLFFQAPNPLKFRTANGQRLEGGSA